MALADILAAIDAGADEEIARATADASNEARRVRHEADDEARLIEREASSALDDEADRRRAQIVNRARLVVERRVSTAVEEIYQELKADVGRRLAEARDQPAYPDLFRRLVDECRAVLPEGRIARVDPADEQLCTDVLASLGCDDFTVVASLETVGGLELVTTDGRRSVQNTLESRTWRADSALRSVAVAEVPALRGGG